MSLNIFPLIIFSATHSQLPDVKGNRLFCCRMGARLVVLPSSGESWEITWTALQPKKRAGSSGCVGQGTEEGGAQWAYSACLNPTLCLLCVCAAPAGEMLFLHNEWGMQWRTVHRQRSMILHKWFIWLLLTWCYHFLTLTSIIIVIIIIIIINRTWISDTSNWSIENKIPMKSYRYPTTIYCCVNRWLFVREIQPREKRREEKRKEKSQWMFLFLRAGKSKNLRMNHSGGRKTQGKVASLMRRIKSTQWNWRGGDLEAMQLTEYCLQITTHTCFSKIKHALGISGG